MDHAGLDAHSGLIPHARAYSPRERSFAMGAAPCAQSKSECLPRMPQRTTWPLHVSANNEQCSAGYNRTPLLARHHKSNPPPPISLSHKATRITLHAGASLTGASANVAWMGEYPSAQQCLAWCIHFPRYNTAGFITDVIEQGMWCQQRAIVASAFPPRILNAEYTHSRAGNTALHISTFECAGKCTF